MVGMARSVSEAEKAEVEAEAEAEGGGTLGGRVPMPAMTGATLGGRAGVVDEAGVEEEADPEAAERSRGEGVSSLCLTRDVGVAGELFVGCIGWGELEIGEKGCEEVDKAEAGTRASRASCC